MSILLAIPILAGLLIFQSAVLSQFLLLRGTADLVLLALVAWAIQKRVETAWHWAVIGGLMVNFISGLPLGVPLVGYALSVGLALALRKRIWQVPFLAMLVAVFFGTLFSHAISYVALALVGNLLPLRETLNLITLPSMLLNLLLALPFYALLGDLASWLYPEELEV